MAKPSYEAILAALLVVGCSKTESVAPAPESHAPKAAAPVESATAPSTAAVESAPAPSATAAAPSPVDAGVERPTKPTKKGAMAACGASGCSPEMKKGSK